MQSASKILSYSNSRRGAAVVALVLACGFMLSAADTPVNVQLNLKKAGPRQVESLTEQAILRDYRLAWTSIAQAFETSSADPLEGPFAGEAKKQLVDVAIQQQQSGLSQRYLNQTHHLDAVFYAPEGDVMELHDTAEYQLEVSTGGKIIHQEHIVKHYVVLMTPAADRWVIHHLQAVPQF